MRTPAAIALATMLVASLLFCACFEVTRVAPCPANRPVYVAAGGYCIAAPVDLGHHGDGQVCNGNGCDLGDGTVAQPCSSSATCPASAPVCAGNVCGACQLDADGGASPSCTTYHAATTPLCGPRGACVQCLGKNDCDSLHLTCDTTSNSCVKCTANADCTSGLCNLSTGSCADESGQLYVDNANPNCSNGACSFSMPCCSLQRGLKEAAATFSSGAKPLIVFGGGNPYMESLQANPAQNGGMAFNVTVIGVNRPIVKPSSGALLTLGGASTTIPVTVSFDGFVFDGTSATGIGCNGDSNLTPGDTTLTITRSTITNATTAGVSASNSTLTMDSDSVINNKGGGISVDGSDFTLTNLLITGNGTSGSSGSIIGGLGIGSAGQSGKMNIANLTVVSNQAKTGAVASGIQCLTTPTTLIDTVIFGNPTDSSVEIQSGPNQCVPKYCAFKGGAGMNVDLTDCTAAQLFVNTGAMPWLPKTGGTRPCTLVDDGTNTGAPDHDLVGGSRPQGAMVDIGCYEAQ